MSYWDQLADRRKENDVKKGEVDFTSNENFFDKEKKSTERILEFSGSKFIIWNITSIRTVRVYRGRSVRMNTTLGESISRTKEVYNLTQVSPEYLANCRLKKEAYLVLKNQGKLYFTQIPDTLSLLGTTFPGKIHQCACGTDDSRQACPFFGVDCPKVTDRFAHIENYDWITDGYETWFPRKNVPKFDADSRNEVSSKCISCFVVERCLKKNPEK